MERGIRFFANRRCGDGIAAVGDSSIWLHFHQMSGRMAASATSTARSAMAAGVTDRLWAVAVLVTLWESYKQTAERLA